MAPAERSTKKFSGEAKASQTRRSRFYIVTLVYNPNEYVSKADLDARLCIIKEYMSKYGAEWSDHVGYELKRNVIHLHTICSCQRSPWIRPIKGWNIQLKEFPESDYMKVVDYIEKQDQHECAVDQRFMESWLYLQKDPFVIEVE